MAAPTLREVYAPGLLMWYELCPPCRKAFEAWRDAPNPAPWANPRVQQYPHLLALLATGGAAGPSPQAWRETVSAQLLLVRRICTDRHTIENLGYGYAARPFAARPGVLPDDWTQLNPIGRPLTVLTAPGLL